MTRTPEPQVADGRAVARQHLLDELVAAGLVPAATSTAGRVRCVDTSRSNPSFLVTVDGAPTLFVKSQTASIYGDAKSTLAHETVVQRMLTADPATSSLAPRAMRLLPTGVLVSEAVAPAIGYGEAMLSARSVHSARQLGVAIARLHRSTTDWCLPQRMPWVIDVEHGWTLGVEHDAIDRIQAAVFADDVLLPALHRVRDDWRATCVIHGDLKWDNVMVRHSGEVVLVDWELAATGDPRWDIAALCAAHRAAGALDAQYCDPSAMRHLLALIAGAYEFHGGEPWNADELRPWVSARLLEHAVLLAVTRPDYSAAPAQLIALARGLAGGSEPW
ncbi:MAG: phosphotransferase [Actinomycetota bacterium]|nr:phosphotransferase [Actinomycetota bacterium]